MSGCTTNENPENNQESETDSGEIEYPALIDGCMIFEMRIPLDQHFVVVDRWYLAFCTKTTRSSTEISLLS